MARTAKRGVVPMNLNATMTWGKVPAPRNVFTKIDDNPYTNKYAGVRGAALTALTAIGIPGVAQIGNQMGKKYKVKAAKTTLTSRGSKGGGGW
jgi:hypothetical protein